MFPDSLEPEQNRIASLLGELDSLLLELGGMDSAMCHGASL